MFCEHVRNETAEKNKKKLKCDTTIRIWKCQSGKQHKNA